MNDLGLPKKENQLLDNSFLFAVRVVKLYKNLIDANKEYVISKQLLRSGTAVGALIREAQNAESKLDFIHKLAIAQKECDETIYWLELLHATEYINDDELSTYKQNAVSLLRMLKSAIITSKSSLQKKG